MDSNDEDDTCYGAVIQHDANMDHIRWDPEPLDDAVDKPSK